MKPSGPFPRSRRGKGPGGKNPCQRRALATQHTPSASNVVRFRLNSSRPLAGIEIGSERCPRGLAQLSPPDPVNPPVDQDLSVLAIADLAAEHTRATAPQDRHAGS